MTSNCSNEQKRYVDELLKLIKIFVTASKVKAEEVKAFDEKSQDGKKEEYVETDSKYVTPKKQIKSSVDAGAGITQFDITQEALFGETDKTENDQATADTKVAEVPLPEVKDKVDKDDDPYAYLRKILASDDLGKQIVEVIDTARLQE